jgi:hypothetical protein
VFCGVAPQQIDDEDDRRTTASEMTEQSELNEPMNDLVNFNQMNNLKILILDTNFKS